MAEQPMRVAYLTSQYPATSHTFISREVAAVRALGVALDTFSIRPPPKAELEDENLAEQARSTFTVLEQPWTRFLAAHVSILVSRPGAYVRTLTLAARHRPPGLRAFGLAMAHFTESVILARELQRRGTNRLHNHFANSGATVGYLASNLVGVPWSFTMHGISETDYPAGLTLGRKIEAADFVACVSYFGRAQAMRLVSPEHWAKLHVVRCGLPVDELPARSAEGRVTRLICVGRLSPEKGHAGLLQAFAALGGKTVLVLVGDGPEEPQLRARAAALGIGDRVTFRGRLGERQTLEEIARSDLLILPSFMEGLPIVLMEAMATGTPVVASRVAGIPELVANGETGLLFTPSRWDELAACMEQLVSDRPLRHRLAAAGMERVLRDFDIRASAKKMAALLAGSPAASVA